MRGKSQPGLSLALFIDGFISCGIFSNGLYCGWKDFPIVLPGIPPKAGGETGEVGENPTQSRYCNWEVAYFIFCHCSVMGWEDCVSYVCSQKPGDQPGEVCSESFA